MFLFFHISLSISAIKAENYRSQTNELLKETKGLSNEKANKLTFMKIILPTSTRSSLHKRNANKTDLVIATNITLTRSQMVCSYNERLVKACCQKGPSELIFCT